MNTFQQLLRTRPRLLVAILIGVVAGLVLPPGWSAVSRALIAWNITVWFYLLLIAWLMLRSTHVQVRKIAEQEDRSASVILVIMTIAAVVSLAAIVLELTAVKELSLAHRLAHYAFTAATVAGSWLLVGTLFTFHYARVYYQSPIDERALRFPDEELSPDYWDFLYFSFTIAVAAQTSDIAVMTRSLRKAVLVQSVLSFVFNVAIVGLSINIAAGLLGT
jgi:uncharacterized membrane protein